MKKASILIGTLKEGFGMKRFGFWALLLVMMIFVIIAGGCGGGGSDGDRTLQGTFIDGPVEGLTYTCTPSGLSGTTDSNGAFSFNAGDKIVFKVGNISLPEVAGANVITPLSFFGENARFDDSEVLHLVRFIMSAGAVDADGNIKIIANPFNGIEGTYGEDLWNDLDGNGEITVDEATAKTHIQDTLFKAYSGDYSGTWSGTVNYPGEGSIRLSGTWEVNIAANGDVVGRYAGTDDGDITGRINPNGDTVLDAGGQAGGIVVWTGKIDLANGTMGGSYRGDYEQGTFTGKKIN
jgi:hypothetical protein